MVLMMIELFILVLYRAQPCYSGNTNGSGIVTLTFCVINFSRNTAQPYSKSIDYSRDFETAVGSFYSHAV